jgi:hypothetical protein
MSDHVLDEFPSLLRGEADRTTLDAAAAHLRECADCRQELVSSLVAHAAVTSAATFAPAAADLPEPSAADVALPDLSGLFAQVRVEAAAQHRPPRRRRWAVLAAAAVVGVAVGVGAVVLTQQATRSSPSAHTIELAPYDQGVTQAKATVVGGDQMRLDAASLPAPGSGKRCRGERPGDQRAVRVLRDERVAR